MLKSGDIEAELGEGDRVESDEVGEGDEAHELGKAPCLALVELRCDLEWWW